jgi:hypothetical protein
MPTPAYVDRPRSWRFTSDVADRLTFARRPQGGAPDLLLDGETVGYVVGTGMNIVDRLLAAGVLTVDLGDPAAPPRPPLRDPAHHRVPPDPVAELDYLTARALRLADHHAGGGEVAVAAAGVVSALAGLRHQLTLRVIESGV